ncbi:hypothetical protein L484_014229 [Morus notabilis]|uniref:HMA domain-containing protein n=1 Tax=Morus notabilis TaxID=981085 RepID=W9SGT5_9ROSA|nr:heavy metal-associated isoprenylated plant protein 39 [Morus notabilis]XP_010105740.1 heavy metal-associated isoprenylated plant protein 39 [Morus notabilis]XP_024027543.1 heavy metal-associated isoprenylated plant protein 39-like [Morus notabilis]XP_024027544.1 heavy metal-associated isoprenylated plant protein 39-like [Morus notabilis]EXC05959.1 hypothetical protein L484_014228 [Morus notabilis]EXC05960.1 hypothetical protein L484_014229 [Morus notabilis]
MKVVVLKIDYYDEKCQKKVMKTVSGHSGVVSIALDTKDKKLTVTGDIDPVSLVSKLRKLCNTEIVSVGAPKAAEKKEEPKKEAAKKEEPKKDQKAEDLQKLWQQAYLQQAYKYPPHYYTRTVEEDPNACVIC